jgi:phenylpropionate dioxygenase-like ring-hydroxylating dioxygenase large terminal subunit
MMVVLTFLSAHTLWQCVRFMGQELVLFRGARGQLGLVDAHCPHLGAHMGVGGTVTPDGCLQCPFHGWKFGVDGKCVEIPYSSGSVPAQAATRAHRVAESHRVIMAWHDAEGREVS